MESAKSLMMLEEKIKLYKQLREEIENLENKKKELVAEILNLMPKETKNVIVSDNRVRRMSQISIRTTLDSAKQFDATKMEEVVDKAKIKELFTIGHPIPGVSKIEYIQVYSLNSEKKDASNIAAFVQSE